jgi:hypothetical protein
MILFLFILSILFFSSLLRIFEVPYFKNAQHVNDLEGFFDNIWLVVMTVTTVGYGDVHPHTIPGKIICIMAALWGATMISLLVLATSSFFELKGNQLKAMKHIDLTRQAANTISLSFKYFLKKKRLYIEKLKFDPELKFKSEFLQRLCSEVLKS